MTEKRYIEGVKGFDDYDAWDNETEQGLSHSEVVNELNRLSEENKQLKQDRNEMFIRERDTENELRDIKYKNEQLRDKLSKYDSIAEKICEWDFDEIVKVMNAQQETEKENEQLKQTIKTIKKLCNQKRIPSFLTTYIPVNCEKRKGCLDNHVVNASNMGKSNFAKEILKVIDGVFE